MSEKKHQKSIEELCRSRLSRTTGGDMWPNLTQTSSHRLFRSPSPRESFSRSRRRSGAADARHSLLTSTEFSPAAGSAQQSGHEAGAAEKRKFYQGSHETRKRPFFPGIPPQVVTHADPPFAGSDTQPLPPINMPRGPENSNVLKQGLGKDDRPFTIYGQMPFDGGVAYDIMSAANEEPAGKRKLESIKRADEQERQTFGTSRPHKDGEQRGKKKCGGKKKGRKGRRFPKPLAWKSPWPEQDEESDMDAEWTDIN